MKLGITMYLCFLLVAEGANSQNLVKDPGFENYTTCPGTPNYAFLNLSYWTDPFQIWSFMPSYMNVCAETDVDPAKRIAFGVPSNYFGYEQPHSGNGYVMLSAGARHVFPQSTSTNLVCYVETQLISPLKPNTTYYFEMYLSLADSSGRIAGKMGVYFSDTAVTHYEPPPPDYYFPPVPQLEMDIKEVSKTGWTKISGCYTAHGGEKYIIIGTFNKTYTSFPAPPKIGYLLASGGYYYIDDVIVKEAFESIKIIPEILGTDSPFCDGINPFPVRLDASASRASFFQWSSGSFSSIITVDSPGTYWVYMQGNICSYTDTIDLHLKPQPKVNLGQDTLVCNKQPLRLTPLPKYANATYKWWNGSPTEYFDANQYNTLYWVDVTVNGCTTRDSIRVTRGETPKVDLGQDSIVCLNKGFVLESPVSFVPNMNFLWNSGEKSPTLFVNNQGLYWLEVNYFGCKARDSITLYSFPLRDVWLGPDTGFCSGIPYLLDATSIGATGYKWNTFEVTPTIYAKRTGLFWAEAYNASCKSRDSVFISIEHTPVPELGNDTSICEGSALILDPALRDTLASTNTTYQWNNGSTKRINQPVTTGLYKVEAANGPCKASDSIFVFIVLPPKIELGPDTLLCEGNTILLDVTTPQCFYTWQDNSIGSTYTVSTTGWYKVIVQKDVCKVMDSIQVTFETKPQINLGPDTAYCFQKPIMLDVSSSGGLSYLWSTNSNDPSIQVNQAGQYWVEVSKKVCIKRDTINLTQYPLPSFDLGPDTWFCKGSSVTLDPKQKFSSYLWNKGQKSQSIVVSKADRYSLVVTDLNGCTGTDSIQVEEKALPVITLGNDTSACEPNFILTPGAFESYQWQDGSNTSTYRVNDYGVYTLKVKDAFNCEGEGRIEVTNDCAPILPAIFVPNVFTPNGDGNNDLFMPVYRELKEVNLQIYDRWGQLVFESNNLNVGWDGSVGGKKQASDVFVYKIMYSDGHSKSKTLKGNVTLLR